MLIMRKKIITAVLAVVSSVVLLFTGTGCYRIWIGSPAIKLSGEYRTYSYSFPVEGGTKSFTITLDYCDSWELSYYDASWLVAQESFNTLTLTATPLKIGDRCAVLTLVGKKDCQVMCTTTLTVKQSVTPAPTVSMEGVKLDPNGGKEKITVHSDSEWTYTQYDKWFKMKITDDGFEIEAEANTTGLYRSGRVIISNPGGDTVVTIGQPCL